MREPFKRAAKVTLSIRKADKAALREALVSAINPMVDYFAAELTALAMRRLDEELERIGQAVYVAVSAFATEVEAPDADTNRQGGETVAARGVVAPSVTTASSKVTRTHEPRSVARAGSSPAPDTVRGGGRASPLPAVAAEQGSTSSRSGLLEQALGPDIARALGEPVADRDAKLRKDGHRQGVTVCSKCGYVGGNARGCGKPTGHPTRKPSFGEQLDAALDDNCRKLEQTRPALTPRGLPTFATSAVPPPPVRAPAPYDTAKAKVDRLAMLRARNAERPADAPLARAGEDDNPNASEHWTREEIDEETAAAEARKLTGELPEPSSSWGF